MFGFVLQSVRSVLPEVTRPYDTLEEEVLTRGLNIIPLDRVEAYQQAEVVRLELISPDYAGSYWERLEAPQISALRPPPDVERQIIRPMYEPDTNSMSY